MDKINTILWATFIAAAYAIWPILGKWSGASGQWVTTTVVASSVIPVIALSASSMAKSPINNWKAFVLLTIAGIINGFAVYIYGMKATDEKVPTGIFIMTVATMTFVLSPLFAWGLNGETLSTRQLFGILTAGIAVYLLKS